MPPYSRLTADSSAAWEKLVNGRGGRAGSWDGSVKATLSVRKKSARTAAAAPLAELWPEMYDGWAGVAISGAQAASGAVSGLPSSAASRMPVTGRQKLYSYLASQQLMKASATAMLSAAKS